MTARADIGVLGLGEAGSLIGADLVRAGARVLGYDPAVSQAADVPLAAGPADVGRRGLVLALTQAADALDAVRSVADDLAPDTTYADLSTASPERKRELAAVVEASGASFADVALMQSVPGRGLRTPALACGPGAEATVAVLAGLGMPIEVLPGGVGAAAARKLARSVFVKGMAAAIAESLAAGERLECADWLRGDIGRTLDGADDAMVEHLVTGSRRHAVRREHEMQAATSMLAELGVPPRIASATREWLGELAAGGRAAA